MRMGLCRCAGALAVIGVLAGSAVSMAMPPAGSGEWEECEYVLGEYSGHVAVYDPEGGALPCQVTDIRVGLLPEADRSHLQEGIPLQSRLELMLLLEDFSS